MFVDIIITFSTFHIYIFPQIHYYLTNRISKLIKYDIK